MIAHKRITKIAGVLMAAAVCLCLCAMACSDWLAAAVGDSGVSMEYETVLFDTDQIMSVNIIMDQDEWEDMLANAADETYYKCDVEINGTTFQQVGIRPKGNTSLSAIVNDPTTDRYSLKLEFDHYIEEQTCFGLDKLILNNNYADATNMKEALIYDMFQYLGADASLYNYASISVNGEYWGVYLALEGVEDSFLLRNYGASNGELYKPEGMEMGGGKDDDNKGGPQMDGQDMPDFANMQMPDMPDVGEMSDMPDGAEGMFGSQGGANLNYTDDDLDSYETIWDGEVTDSGKSDHKRVIKALKHISEGTDLEKYMDIDNLLRYMAVHIFAVNDDSLSGSMAHNYYLYESGGTLNLLPWDYNLSLGGMNGSGDASSVINSAIDDAFSATNFFDTLMENEEYHEKYYAWMRQLVEEYVAGGGFDAFYNRVRGQIDELVKTDPNAFYSYDEYVTAAETLYQTVKLRGESIEGQLDGTIPSTAQGQQGSDALIDASSLDLSVMGSMNMGRGQGDDETAESTVEGGNFRKPFGQGDRSTSEANGTLSMTQQNLILYGGCLLILVLALIFALCFCRTSRKR